MKNIQPLGENVLVRIGKKESVTQSGIVLPDSTAEEAPQEGEIVAVGESEKVNKLIRKGSKVLFEKYNGMEVEVEKEKYLLIKADKILAVLV